MKYHRSDRRTYLDGGFRYVNLLPRGKQEEHPLKATILNGAFILGALVVLLFALDVFYFGVTRL